MKKVLLVISVVILFALIRPVLWMYEFFTVQNPILLSDILNYCSNTLPGLIALIFSYSTFKNSIEASKGIVAYFIERSCLGFRENNSGRASRYYHLKYSNLIEHLQRLKNAKILNQSDVELCKKLHDYVRNLKDDKPQNVTSPQITNPYREFWNADEYQDNIKDILRKLN